MLALMGPEYHWLIWSAGSSWHCFVRCGSVKDLQYISSAVDYQWGCRGSRGSDSLNFRARTANSRQWSAVKWRSNRSVAVVEASTIALWSHLDTNRRRWRTTSNWQISVGKGYVGLLLFSPTCPGFGWWLAYAFSRFRVFTKPINTHTVNAQYLPKEGLWTSHLVYRRRTKTRITDKRRDLLVQRWMSQDHVMRLTGVTL